MAKSPTSDPASSPPKPPSRDKKWHHHITIDQRRQLGGWVHLEEIRPRVVSLGQVDRDHLVVPADELRGVDEPAVPPRRYGGRRCRR